jgi:malonyl-CoA O-methyltransferase
MLIKIKENFNRVADNYERYADIQSDVADELLRGLLKSRQSHKAILDIGCGTGKLTAELKRHFLGSRVFALDISQAMAKSAGNKGLSVLAADARYLPFSKEVFDLVISSAAYQWIFDLEKAFREVNKILEKDGIFTFSCFGEKTLCEVRRCFSINENLLPAEDCILKNLKGAGFRDIQIKIDLRQKDFGSLNSILYWLKNIGGNRINSPPPFLTPGKLKLANDFYQSNYRNNGSVYATFEVIWASGRK